MAVQDGGRQSHMVTNELVKLTAYFVFTYRRLNEEFEILKIVRMQQKHVDRVDEKLNTTNR